MIKRWVLTLLLGFAAIAPIGAEQVEPSKPRIEHLFVLEDVRKQLTFAEVLNPAAAWQPLPVRGLAKGYSRSVFWIKADISVPTHRAILTVLPSFLDSVLFMVPEPLVALPDRFRFQSAEVPGWLQSQQGDFYPTANRILNWRGFSLDLRPSVADSSKSHTLYIRLETGSASLLQVGVWAERDFQSQQGKELLIFGSIIGSAFVFSLVGVFFWTLQRHQQFAHYLLFAFSALLWYLSVNGFLSQLAPIPSKAASHLVGFSVCTMFGAVAMLMRKLLEAGEQLPRLDAFLRFSALLQIIVAPLAFLDGYRYFAQWLNLLALVQWMAMLFMTVRLFSVRTRLGLNLLTMYAMLIMVNTAMLLGFLFGITPADITLQILQFVIFLDLLILMPILLVRNDEVKRNLVLAKSRAEVAAQKLALEEQTREEQHKWVQMITHELRTPLTIIDAARQFLSRNTQDAMSIDRLEKISRATQRLTSLIDSFVLEDEVGESRRRLQSTKISVASLLATLQTILPEETLDRLQVQDSSSIESFQADRDLVIIALTNLVQNAARHSPAESPIHLLLHKRLVGQAQSVEFATKNLGAPISVEHQARLFERYFRSGENAGMGLGLWACHEIAVAHGGICDYREEPADQGLVQHVFRIVFPCDHIKSDNDLGSDK